jgi:hypothetical protein
MSNLKEDIQSAVFDYMDRLDCPQVFTEELRQTIAEDIAYDVVTSAFLKLEKSKVEGK